MSSVVDKRGLHGRAEWKSRDAKPGIQRTLKATSVRKGLVGLNDTYKHAGSLVTVMPTHERLHISTKGQAFCLLLADRDCSGKARVRLFHSYIHTSIPTYMVADGG